MITDSTAPTSSVDARLTRWDWVPALALSLTMATQFRPESVPVGPGELLLILWILFRMPITLRSLVHGIPRPHRITLQFLVPAVLVMITGMLYSRLVEPGRTLEPHDLIALMLDIAVIATLMVDGLDGPRARRFLLYIIAFTLPILTVLGFAALGGARLGPIDPRMDGVRFYGWAENPNQTALLLSWVSFVVAGILFSRGVGRGQRALALVGLLSCFWIGMMTLSDALRLGWMVGFAYCGVLWLFRALRGPTHRSSGFRALVLISIPLVVLLAVWLGGIAVERASNSATEVYEAGEQGAVRLLLWKNGLVAFTRSPVFGWGPGDHSGVTGPFGGIEAHNTPIDWLADGGILGGILGLVFLLRVGRIIYFASPIWLQAAALSLFLYGLTHNISRHPMVYAVTLCLMAIALDPRRGWRLSPGVADRSPPPGSR